MRPRDWLSRFEARGDRLVADLESLVSQEDMERRRDEILGLIRG